ncbi:hypothetical protein LTR95_012326, partial [Oleoguttula sp. CCFEE 5521]
WDPDEQSGLVFKSENVFAQGRPRKPRASKAKVSHATQAASPAVITSSSSGPVSDVTTALAVVDPIAASSPRSALGLSLEEHAFLHWTAQCVFRHDDLSEPGHEYNVHVLQHWIEAKPGSSLHFALSALSLAFFGRSRHAPAAVKDAERAYCRALARTQRVVCGEEKETINHLLLTAMLMGTFENMVNGHSTSASARPDAGRVEASKVFTHYDGALALLKLQRQETLASCTPIERVVRRQLVRANILRGSTVPEWLADGESYGESGPTLELDAMLVRVGRLRADFLATGAGVSNDKDYISIIVEADVLNVALRQWHAGLPEDWKHETVFGGQYPFELIAKVHERRTHGHAAVILRYRATRILVNSIIDRCLSCTASPQNNTDTARETIAELAGTVCQDVPYFFNQVGSNGSRWLSIGKHIINSQDDITPKLAGLLAWPLSIVVSCDALPAKQREWLRERLRTVAAAYGDARLQQVAEGGVFSF